MLLYYFVTPLGCMEIKKKLLKIVHKSAQVKKKMLLFVIPVRYYRYYSDYCYNYEKLLLLLLLLELLFNHYY